MKKLVAVFVVLALTGNAALRAENISFPAGAGVLDVKDARYGAKGDGTTDDSAAIQKAISEGLARHKVVYLPNGVYRVADTLKWNNGDPKSKIGGWGPFLQLQGQSRAGTVIRLQDGAPGFEDSAKPKAVIQSGSSGGHGNKKYQNGEGNEAFENHIRNLTVDVGARNAGAVGIDWQASNVGALRHVTIKTSDAQSGFCGLDLTRRDNGPGLIKNVAIEGFRFGIRARQEIAQFVLEDVSISGQREAGIQAEGAMLAIRKLRSQNSVPAVKLLGAAFLTLLDSQFLGGASAAAIETDGKSQLLIRNLQTAGYAAAWKHGASVADGKDVSQWLSAKPFGGAGQTFSLPIRETPEWHDDNTLNWADAGAPGGKDDTAAIQAAMNEGKSTVFFRSGTYRIGDTISVPASVRLITSAGTSLNTVGAKILPDEKPMFRLEGGKESDLTIFDRFTISAKKGWFVEHRGARTVVLRDLIPFGARLYKNETGAGPLFVEDGAGDDLRLEPGTQMWARQLDIEGFAGVDIINNGAKIWALGWKHEGDGTLLRNSGGAQSELLGGFIYTFGIKPDSPAFINDESSLALSFAGTSYVAKSGFFSLLVRDTQKQQTLEFRKPDAPRRGNGAFVPFYLSVLGAPRPEILKPPAPPTMPVAVTTAPQSTPDGTVFKPPTTMTGATKGDAKGNPVEVNGKAMWRFDQVWPDDILQVENYRPLVWNDKNWRAKTDGSGGHPEARIKDGRVILSARSASKDSAGQKLAALVFIAPETGQYSLRGQASAWTFVGSGSARQVALKIDRASGRATQLAAWDLPKTKDAEIPIEAAAVALEAGQEIALVPQLARSNTGATITLSGLAFVRAN